MKTDHRLEQLASKIADDEPIDWREVDYHGNGVRELERVVRGFRHVNESSRAARPARNFLFDFGHLHVIEKIGSGSLGDVYHAYDPGLDLHVALKLRKAGSPAIAADALQEAKCLAKVRQANVVSVYGAAQIDGQVGIWMEWVRGKTLDELLMQNGACDAHDVQSIGVDLCHALEAVHRQGLVHGDIKLQNIMREDGGRVVLLDFGIARNFRRDAAEQFVSGTLRYLAPEVLRGETASPASDQYSLGVALFRLLTGRYPYASADYDALRKEHDRGTPATLPDGTPPSLIRSIRRAISIDETKRFGSIRQFGASLNPDTHRRSPIAWRSVAALLLAVIAVAAVVWHFYAPRFAAWQTQVQFYRINDNGRVPLGDGSTLIAGDRLTLDVQSTKPVYLYVLNSGGDSAEILFPRPDMQPSNPLPANVDTVLPGTIQNRSYKWRIQDGSASDEFVVIASTDRQPQLDAIAMRTDDAPPDSGPRRSASLVPEDNRAVDRSAIDEFLRKHDVDVSSANAFDAHVRYWRFVFPHPHSD